MRSIRLIGAIIMMIVWSSGSFAQSLVLRNDLLNKDASEKVRQIGDELFSKTGVSVYLVATHEHFPEKYNIVSHIHAAYGTQLKEPYVVLVVAPFATIRKDIDAKGRFALVASDRMKNRYDADQVRDATVDIMAVKDGHKLEDKVTIGVVQGYSVLCESIAQSYGKKLENAIPDTTHRIVAVLQWIIYAGSFIVIWFLVLKPAIKRIQRGK